MPIKPETQYQQKAKAIQKIQKAFNRNMSILERFQNKAIEKFSDDRDAKKLERLRGSDE